MDEPYPTVTPKGRHCKQQGVYNPKNKSNIIASHLHTNSYSCREVSLYGLTSQMVSDMITILRLSFYLSARLLLVDGCFLINHRRSLLQYITYMQYLILVVPATFPVNVRVELHLIDLTQN